MKGEQESPQPLVLGKRISTTLMDPEIGPLMKRVKNENPSTCTFKPSSIDTSKINFAEQYKLFDEGLTAFKPVE